MLHILPFRIFLKYHPGQAALWVLQLRDGEGVQQSSLHHQVWGKDMSLPPVQAETIMH